jgi:hypothetical protein
MNKRIRVEKLERVFCIFADTEDAGDTWGTNCTREDVLQCIGSGRLEAMDYHKAQMLERDDYCHAARVAYLVLNKDKKPIDIDVGAPSFGYYGCALTDGNHRLGAAMIRGDKTINATVAGELAYYRHLFVKKMARYKDI